jgi:ferredoxin-type protein NapG
VLPRGLALGESSDRYVRGWKREDEKRLEEAPEETRTVTPRSEKDALDYLNREGF